MQLVHGLNFKNIRGDLFGGLTAAIVALPLALAFGRTSGAGAIAGLYGAIFVGFFAALFGGTPSQISGPTGPMTVVMATVFTGLIAKNPESGLVMGFTVVILGGVFQIILGLLRLGKYITLMPYTVISGFMSGIGLIILTIQISLCTGERMGAIVQLKVSDVYDYDGKVLSYITFGKTTRKASKHGVAETRQIPIHPDLRVMLERYSPFA